MATRKRPAKAKDPSAPPKPKGPPRVRRDFLESQLNAGRVLGALRGMGCQPPGESDERFVSRFRRAYDAQSQRRRAKWNDPVAVAARLAELTGEVPKVNFNGAEIQLVEVDHFPPAESVLEPVAL